LNNTQIRTNDRVANTALSFKLKLVGSHLKWPHMVFVTVGAHKKFRHLGHLLLPGDCVDISFSKVRYFVENSGAAECFINV